MGQREEERGARDGWRKGIGGGAAGLANSVLRTFWNDVAATSPKDRIDDRMDPPPRMLRRRLGAGFDSSEDTDRSDMDKGDALLAADLDDMDLDMEDMDLEDAGVLNGLAFFGGGADEDLDLDMEDMDLDTDAGVLDGLAFFGGGADEDLEDAGARLRLFPNFFALADFFALAVLGITYPPFMGDVSLFFYFTIQNISSPSLPSLPSMSLLAACTPETDRVDEYAIGDRVIVDDIHYNVISAPRVVIARHSAKMTLIKTTVRLRACIGEREGTLHALQMQGDAYVRKWFGPSMHTHTHDSCK